MDASIVIPTFNRADLLHAALASVCALNVPPQVTVECIVVDNNSTDDTRSVVERFSNDRAAIPIRWTLETRQGLNNGRNKGLAESRGHWTIFLDDDMLVNENWLSAFFSTVETFSPNLVTGPVEPMFEGDIPPWCVPHVLDSVTSSYSQKGDQARPLRREESHEVPGCNFAVRTDLGHKIGGFHPELDRAGGGMLAGGDTEFAMRVADAQGLSLYVPGCRIRHLVSANKMSRAGLLARWRGLGASEKKLREIRGQPRYLPPLRAHLRAMRFRARALWLDLGERPEAFRWHLEAERLKHAV